MITIDFMMFCLNGKETIAMDYISTKLTSDKQGISSRRVQHLCEQGRVLGAIRISRVRAIPKEAPKPSGPALEAKQ